MDGGTWRLCYDLLTSSHPPCGKVLTSYQAGARSASQTKCKVSARFHFRFLSAYQGFTCDQDHSDSPRGVRSVCVWGDDVGKALEENLGVGRCVVFNNCLRANYRPDTFSIGQITGLDWRHSCMCFQRHWCDPKLNCWASLEERLER